MRLAKFLLVVAPLCAGCKIHLGHSQTPQPHAETIHHMAVQSDPVELEIQAMVDKLYASFCFDAGQQADWQTMRSLFADGANFANPIRPGSPVKLQNADGFLADFKSWVNSDTRGFHERIIRTDIQVFGNIATAAVTFEGFVPGNDKVESLGLDNLQLVLDQGAWKLASFTSQYASEGLPMPARLLPQDRR